MGSVLLRCLARICCDDTEDENSNHDHRNMYHRRIAPAAAVTSLTSSSSSPQNSSSTSPPVMVRALMSRDDLNSSSGNENIDSLSLSLQEPAGTTHLPIEDHNCYQRQESEGAAAAAVANTTRRDSYRLRRRSGNDNEQQPGDIGDGDDVCCPFHQKQQPQHPDVRGIFDFFRQVQERWHQKRCYYDSLGQTDRFSMTSEYPSAGSAQSPQQLFPHPVIKPTDDGLLKGETKKLPLPPPSPLRTAITFDASREIPTIQPEEVVLPGSLLQQQMAESMMSSLLLSASASAAGGGGGGAAAAGSCAFIQNHLLVYPHHLPDECVICMEPFEDSNPRMPTLCGCGENKAYFHLPCLYQWMEQSNDCPSCRQALTWQEFT